jgi:hypothetical protein
MHDPAYENRKVRSGQWLQGPHKVYSRFISRVVESRGGNVPLAIPKRRKMDAQPWSIPQVEKSICQTDLLDFENRSASLLEI